MNKKVITQSNPVKDIFSNLLLNTLGAVARTFKHPRILLMAFAAALALADLAVTASCSLYSFDKDQYKTTDTNTQKPGITNSDINAWTEVYAPTYTPVFTDQAEPNIFNNISAIKNSLILNIPGHTGDSTYDTLYDSFLTPVATRVSGDWYVYAGSPGAGVILYKSDGVTTVPVGNIDPLPSSNLDSSTITINISHATLNIIDNATGNMQKKPELINIVPSGSWGVSKALSVNTSGTSVLQTPSTLPYLVNRDSGGSTVSLTGRKLGALLQSGQYALISSTGSKEVFDFTKVTTPPPVVNFTASTDGIIKFTFGAENLQGYNTANFNNVNRINRGFYLQYTGARPPITDGNGNAIAYNTVSAGGKSWEAVDLGSGDSSTSITIDIPQGSTVVESWVVNSFGQPEVVSGTIFSDASNPAFIAAIEALITSSGYSTPSWKNRNYIVPRSKTNPGTNTASFTLKAKGIEKPITGNLGVYSAGIDDITSNPAQRSKYSANYYYYEIQGDSFTLSGYSGTSFVLVDGDKTYSIDTRNRQ